MSLKKDRIDTLIVKKGLVESREKAKKYVMAGRVYIGTLRIDKPGTKVAEDSSITIKGDPIPYVGRGGLKLEKALKSFHVTVSNKTAIDIGASTGGFTDCMLQNGAEKVYAVDVGYGQLAWKLRNDDRVIPIEKTNIRYATVDTIGELVDLATIDVSFISLKLVLPVARNLTKNTSDIIALIKPQFEAGRDNVGKKGIVRDKDVHKRVILEIYEFCKTVDLNLIDLTFSPVTGGAGNIEYLAQISKEGQDTTNMKALVDEVVHNAHASLQNK